jgi:hypothetical protein
MTGPAHGSFPLKPSNSFKVAAAPVLRLGAFCLAAGLFVAAPLLAGTATVNTAAVHDGDEAERSAQQVQPRRPSFPRRPAEAPVQLAFR